MNLDEARIQLSDLENTLRRTAERDPEQEVRGMAVPVLATIIEEVKKLLPSSEVARSVGDVITEELVSGEAVRAIDLLLVVSALLNALPVQEFRTRGLS